MKCFKLSVLFVVMVSLASVTQAAAVITNGSFESPEVSNYGPTIDAWTSNSSVEYDAGVLNINGWASTADAAADGVQHAFIKNDNYIYQTVGTVEAEQTYVLTVAATQEFDITEQDTTFSISLWDNDAGAALATMNGVTASVGEGFVDYTISFDTLSGNNAAAVGHSMSVVLANALASDAATNQVYFDNVRLTDGEAVPEPASIALLTTGLLGVMCYTWRKRK